MNQRNIFIQQTLGKLLPSSIIGEIVSFVFYDHHPRDKLTLDVITCTHRGEVFEFNKHELISSLILENIGQITQIKLLRNSKCELFYLVVTHNEILILSRRENLTVHYRVDNVESYSIDDIDCKGQAQLKVILKDDAVPLIFDDNFDNLKERQFGTSSIGAEENLPIVAQLMTKLNEAKYTTKHNEQKYEEYINLRQAAAISVYQKTTFSLEDSVSKLTLDEISNILQVSAKPPIVKLCNKKVVIIIGITNNNNVSIHDVSVLLHTELKQSMEYITKLFKNTPKPPHWEEKDLQLDSHSEAIVVTVVDLKELQYSLTSRIELEIVVSYNKAGKCHLLPIKSVSLSYSEIMEKNSDILLCGDIDTSHFILSLLSTSESFDLKLRHIKRPDDSVVTLSDIFYTYLKMEKYLDNVAIHKMSPFDILYGVMIVFANGYELTEVMNVKVYTRDPSQLLALIHYIYDIVPHRIIITTSDYKIIANTDDLFMYNEKSDAKDKRIDYITCASSVCKEIKIIREYLDECMVKMSENNDEKVGQEIDLMANGLPKYLEFRNEVLEEKRKGIKSITRKEKDSDAMSEDCIIIE